MADMSNRVIQVTQYDLVQPRQAYIAAIQALAERTQREGHPGVLGYQFYASTDEESAGAVVIYSDANAWIAHHQLAYKWEEMPRLQATVKLRSLTLFGPLSAEVIAWLEEVGLSYTHYGLHAAGFVRDLSGGG